MSSINVCQRLTFGLHGGTVHYNNNLKKVLERPEADADISEAGWNLSP